MPLRFGKTIANAAYRSRATRVAVPALVGGSMVAGGIAGVLDPQGPYPAIAEDIVGDRRFLNTAAKGALRSAAFGENDVAGTSDYYYGRPADPRQQRVRNAPPPGDIVLGMYNLRR